MSEPIGYSEAIHELEEILEQIDGEAVDVDQLSARVRRAAELIQICRGKINATRLEIEEIVADLTAATDTETVATPGAEPVADQD